MWEDRQSRRMPVDAELVLYHNGVPAASGKVRNVSLDGLFVTTDTSGFSRDDYVEIEYRSRSGSRTYRFPAIVVHSEEGGVGLYVERDDRRASEGIRALMGIHKGIRH